MLRTTIRRHTGTVGGSVSITHGFGITADFWAIQKFGAIGAIRQGNATRVTNSTGANAVRAINTLQTNCTVDVVMLVYQGRLY